MNLVNVAIAFGAGVISITSPCCLPLLPGYLGYLSGLAPDEVNAGNRRVVAAASLFVLGFTAVFAGLGATASIIGQTLLLHREGLGQIAGTFILVMGLFIVLSARIPLLARGGDWTSRWGRGQMWAAAPMGAAFAITWTPCIGPVLGGILALAGSSGDLGQGTLLLVVYSLGLGVPFMALSLSVRRVKALMRRTARATAIAHMASGVILVAMGGLLITNQWLPLMTPVLRFYAKAQWPPV
ncbi:MAG: cytochrome c biogenesis CcdA family protein [Candidatus Dormibacteria bacterium]